MDFASVSQEAYPWKSYVQSTWLKDKESCQPGSFCKCLARNLIPQSTHKTFCLAKSYVLLYQVFTHNIYIYSHYPQIVRSAFQRENPRKYTWELEIIIPTIIYTFPYDFPQLLPLYLHILERLITQTLTTLVLSVKWEFGAVGKYWKEPFIGESNRAELRDSKSKRRQGSKKSFGSRSLEGSSTWGRLGLEGLLLFMYSNFII